MRARQRAAKAIVRGQPIERADDEVVEVEPARLRDRAPVRDVGGGHRPRRRIRGDLLPADPEVELQPGEGEVQPAAVGPRGPRVQLAQHRVPIDERLHRDAGVREDLAPERVERPDSYRTRGDAQRLERRVEPLDKLVGRPLVERDEADRGRRRPAVDEPGHPRDQGRGLPGSGRRNAQDRSRGRGGGRPLVRREAAEAVHDRLVHPRTMKRPTYRSVNRGLVQFDIARAGHSHYDARLVGECPPALGGERSRAC